MRLTITFLLAVSFTALSSNLVAQKLIALHHAGAASFHPTPLAAYNAAVNGDTIYIPGGNFDGFTLQKSLTLIGAGHHPDSTLATGRTVLGSLNVFAGADNSVITGIFFTNQVYVSQAVSGVAISRCYLNVGMAFQSALCTGWIISENWIGLNQNSYAIYGIPQGSGVSLSNFLLSNNVIQYRVTTLLTSEISNNILLSDVLSASSCIIKNNIFSGSNSLQYTGNCQWLNNLNSGINGGPTAQNNTGSGNYLDNVTMASVFTSFTNGNSLYPNNFHVVNTNYTGTDGQPIGIYGGVFPWKDGSLPYNPHIRAKTIGATTNPDGTLHINVTVKAQGN